MKFTYASLCIGAALSSFPILASTLDDNDQKIESIEVLGHKLSALNHDVASSVSVLSKEQINRQQAADLNQILTTLPGVEFSGSVNPLSGQPAIRGLYGERIYISVDNVKRKIDSDGNQNIAQINSLGVNPDQLKQIQVLRGADSLTVGSGAIGGSIRLVTKDASDYLAQKEGFGARFSVQHESVSDANDYNLNLFYLDGSSDTVLSIGQVEYDDIDVVAKKGADEQGQIQSLSKIKNKSKRQNATLKNTWYFNDHHSLKSKFDYSKTESVDQPYGQRLDLAFTYPTLAEDYKNDYFEGMLKYTYQGESDYVDFDAHAFYAKKTYNKVTKGFIERGTNKIHYDEINEGESTRKGIRFANLSTLDGYFKHKLAVELQYDAEDFSQTQFQDKQASTYYGNSDAQNWSLSLIDQSGFWNERLLITAGLRFDAFKRESDYFREFDSNSDNELSSELGVTFKVTDYLNMYVKSAEAFRAPSLQELYKQDEWRCHIGGKICYSEPQPDLKPEDSNNLEVGFGLSWQSLKYADNVSFKAIYFDNEINNYINNVPFMYYIDANGDKQLGSPGPKPVNGVPVATHRDYSAKNIGKLLSHGIEIEAQYSYKSLDMYLGYSTINMDIIGMPDFFLGTTDQTQQPYIDAPADKITWNTNYQFTAQFNFGLQMLHYSEQQRLSDTYLEYGYGTDTYTVYNINAKYQATSTLEGLVFRLGVDNLTNKRYLRAPATEASDPAELGRNYKLSVSYQF